MIAGPNNELWIAIDDRLYIIGRGYVPNPTPLTGIISSMMLGPDNAVWFSFGIYPSTGNPTYEIGRATRDGVTNIYSSENAFLFPGPNGDVWYISNGIVKKFNPGGQPEQIASVSGCGVNAAVGPDGALWIIGDPICRLDLGTKVVTKYPLPGAWTCLGGPCGPRDFTFAPGGGLWFIRTRSAIGGPNNTGSVTTESQVGRLKIAAGIIDTWPVSGTPIAITVGPDGALLFANVVPISGSTLPFPYVDNKAVIDRITEDGTQSEYAVLRQGLTADVCPHGASPAALGTGADGNIYVIQSDSVGGLGQLGCPVNQTVLSYYTVKPDAVLSITSQGAAFSNAQYLSFIRLYATQAGSVLVNLINPDTGQPVGQTSVPVSLGAMKQIGVQELEQVSSSTKPAYYAISLQPNSSFSGYYQHVLWDQTQGVLSNLTACAGPVTPTAISFVDSSSFSNYPSSIVIANTSAQSTISVGLDVFDKSGGKLGGLDISGIPANGSKLLSVAEIEQRAGIHPDPSNLPQYTIKPRGPFSGTLQHLVTNQQAGGVLTDMTVVCPLSAQ